MLAEGVLGALKSSERKDLKEVLAALVEAHGHEPVNVAMIAAAQAQNAVRPFQRGRVKAAEMQAWEESEVSRLWFGLYPGKLTYICGETGAGKSSLLYNLFIHAARNEPLWDIPFGLGRPAKVLYIDPENSGSFEDARGGVCKSKLARIEQGWPELLEFHDGAGINLSRPEHFADLEQVLTEEKFDACVLDPIINLYGTKDENDNAEAGAQFTALLGMAKRTNVAMAAVHHTGRDAASMFGRGATARLSAADVGLMFRVRGEVEEADDDFGTGETLKDRDDFIRVQTVKNRVEPYKPSIYLQMAGRDKFTRVSFADWKAANNGFGNNGQTRAGRAYEEIQAFLADGLWHTRAEMVAAMRKEGIGQVNTDEALARLEANEVVKSERRGRGGALSFILASASRMEQTQDRSFVVSQSSKEVEKLQNFNEMGAGASGLDRFMQDTPPRSPYKDDSAADEEGWE